MRRRERAIFRCPHCGTLTRIDRSLVGRTGPCADCGREVTIDRDSLVEGAESGEASVDQRNDDRLPWEIESHFRVPRDRWKGALLAIAIALGLTLGLVVAGWFVLVVLLPVLELDTEGERRLQDRARLERVLDALAQYHADHGSYPPAVVRDPNGRPLYGWRALLIPYLDDAGSFADYDYSLPWDAPENLRFQTLPMPAFQPSPPSHGADLHHTGFMVVVGERTMFPPDRTRTALDAVDGADRTALVVQVPDSGVHWLEPKDLDRNAFIAGLPSSTAIGTGAGTTDLWIGRVDGQTVRVRADSGMSELEPLFDRDDGR